MVPGREIAGNSYFNWFRRHDAQVPRSLPKTKVLDTPHNLD